MDGVELLAELEAMPSEKWTEGPTALDLEEEVLDMLRRRMIEDAERIAMTVVSRAERRGL